MQNTDIPLKLPLPFGADAGGGYIRTIPVASQIGVVDGAASLTDGFVPLNATPIGAGGIPPDIKDMNGILFEISGWSRWIAAGGPVYYDGAFATAIGGYPKGAALQSATTPGLVYFSSVDNNSSNPDSGGANWVSLTPVPATLAELIAGTVTTKFVTPAALAGLRADTAAIRAGTDAARYTTPLALAGARATNADVRAGTATDLFVTPASLAVSNSTGIIYHPGGVIQQYGTDLRTLSSESSYSHAFPTPFPNAVDTVVLSPILNAADYRNDPTISWDRSATTLATMTYIFGHGEYARSINGVSFVAFGR